MTEQAAKSAKDADSAKAKSLPGVPSADAEPSAAVAGAVLLRIEAVTKKFGAQRAVDRLSLDIRSGEFFALLGPSGCGKTTLLRMLAGFETPDEGRILLGGADIAQVLPHQRPINMMFQNYALFPHLNVRDNIAFGLKRARMPRAEIDTCVAEMIALARLEGLEKRKSRISSPAAKKQRMRWRWRARWRAARRCCCSTSRWLRSTRSCAKVPSSN